MLSQSLQYYTYALININTHHCVCNYYLKCSTFNQKKIGQNKTILDLLTLHLQKFMYSFVNNFIGLL